MSHHHTTQTSPPSLPGNPALALGHAVPPGEWPHGLAESLRAEERVLAVFPLDLDESLAYSQGWLALTTVAVHAQPGAGQAWQVHALTVNARLQHHDHAGVATLEWVEGERRVRRWRFTLAQNVMALRWQEQFERQVRVLATGEQPQEEEHLNCPSCKAPLPADSEECPICTRELETPPSTWVLLRLWRFAKPYQWPLLAGFLLMLASTSASQLPYILTKPLTDEVLIPFQNGTGSDHSTAMLYLLGMLGAAVFSWGLDWAKTYILALVSERISADLRTATFEHLLKLSLEYFGSKRTGDLMARIGSESDRISVFLSLHALDFISDILMLAMTAGTLFYMNAQLALVTLLPLPLIAWLIHLVRDRLRTGFERIDRAWGEVTNVLADTIPGIRVVKAFAQEQREAQRFRDANRQNLLVNDKLNKTWSLFSPTVALLTEVGRLVVWGFGIWLIAGHAITVGTLIAFIGLISRFYTRLDSMSRIVSVTQKAAAGAKRIFDILDQRSNVPEPEHPVPLPKVLGQVEMRDVGFRYGNRAVIRGLNLSIRPGEMIGLVGHSGSGKSTLVNLICRFYDVTEGAIMVDGHDVRRFAVSDFRRHIGLVLQEPFLFFGTIAENIAYGKPDATREEIVAAARAAHAHEFILRLPHGYDSLVGERGQGLSGGERQRISIARALLINPRVLIMDEATSAVDTETEKEIQKALDNLVKGRTTIAIAHRLSTLRKADRLVVMDRGQVVEVGPHDELMAKQGAYWRLYEAQARRVDQEDELVVSPHPVNAHPAGQA